MNRVRLTERLRAVFQNGLVRSVATLVGGTAVAQVIWFVSTPILTRIYSAADFSSFGAFVAWMSMLSIVSCLGYDSAVMVPEHENDAASVLVLALVVSGVFALLCCVAVLVAPADTALGSHGMLLPLVVLLAGAFSALQFWASRRKQFTDVASVRVVQAVGGVATQIGTGSFGLTPVGLVLGQGANFLLGVVLLGRRVGLSCVARSTAKPAALQAVAWRYRKFALMTAPALLANSAQVQVPVLVVAAMGKPAEAGFLFLAMRVMQAPLSTVGAAVSQVFYAEAPQASRDGRLPQLTADVIKRLSQFGLGPLLFAGIVGQPAFELIFGQGWARAGEIVAWMVPWLALQFLASPISMLLYALERQRVDLYLQIFGLVVRVGPVLAVSAIAPDWLPEAFALTGLVFYAVYLLVLRQAVGMTMAGLLRAIGSSWWLVLAWCGAGLAVLAALRLNGWMPS